MIWGTLLAFALSAALTPVVRRLAIRCGVVDHPDGIRKLHAQSVPLGGGVAIVLSYLIAVAALMIVPNDWQLPLLNEKGYLASLALSFTVICIVGLIDDRFNLRGRQKLAGQLVAIAVVISSDLFLPAQFSSGLVIQKFAIFDYQHA